MRRLAPLAAAAACACAGRQAPLPAAVPEGPKPGLYAVLATDAGPVELRLFQDDAPKTVAAFTRSLRAGGFDGVPFARTVPGFLVQAAARGAGGRLPLEAVAGRGFERAGRVAAPAEGGASAEGEFFVTLLPAPWLDGTHAVFGEVTAGLPLLDEASRSAAPLVVRSARLEDRP